MHSGDPGYTRYTNEWEGLGNREFRAFPRNGAPAFLALASEKSPLIDAHGVDHRPRPGHPLPDAEVHAGRVPEHLDPAVRGQAAAPLRGVAGALRRGPFEVFKRNVWLHAFHEPDPKGLIDLGIPVDHIMFGSDFPHPEGMADPLAYSEVVAGLPVEEQALIMGGSIAKALKVGQYAA